MRTSDENQGLRDHSNLEVDNRMETGVVSRDRVTVQRDAKFVFEEIGLEDDAHQGDTKRNRLEGDKREDVKGAYVEAVRYNPYAMA